MQSKDEWKDIVDLLKAEFSEIENLFSDLWGNTCAILFQKFWISTLISIDKIFSHTEKFYENKIQEINNLNDKKTRELEDKISLMTKDFRHKGELLMNKIAELEEENELESRQIVILLSGNFKKQNSNL